MSTPSTTATSNDDHEMQLPGFRFHPTDEELVGFYLRRKVDNKPLRIELIKQIDIYKHDPWDLPKIKTTAENEGYFFCKRGRKYRNSIRPNRVTGSGFWKATGIDKQVFSLGGEGRDCIGLKKTLVYYRGSAGKGTKTDWMMHEFRLPSKEENNGNTNAKSTLQEAEVWTICRIFKRNVSYRKYTPDWRESSSTSKRHSMESTSKTSAMEYSNIDLQESYISFESPAVHQTKKLRPFVVDHQINESVNNQLPVQEEFSSTMVQSPTMASSTSFQNSHGNDQWFTYENWDDLRSVVEFALDSSFP